MTQPGLAVEILGTIPSTWRDFTPALMYDRFTLKAGTLDFEIVDPVANGITLGAWFIPGAPVRVLALGWTGVIASIESRDPVDVIGHVSYAITATAAPVAGQGINLGAIPPSGSTQTLSDAPTSVTDDYLLEDGSGTYLLEDGTLTQPGSYEMEGARQGYARLSVRTQTNAAATIPAGGGWSAPSVIPAANFSIPTTSTLGTLRMFTGGLWPGGQFTLISTNQGVASTVYTVTETTVTLEAGKPVFTVQFGLSQGDLPWNLNSWKKV